MVHQRLHSRNIPLPCCGVGRKNFAQLSQLTFAQRQIHGGCIFLQILAVLGAGVGVVVSVPGGVAVVAVADPLEEKVRSTQYWLACQLFVGKALSLP